jgi:hypothetical protein
MAAGREASIEKFLEAECTSTEPGWVPPFAVTTYPFPFGKVVEEAAVVYVGDVKPPFCAVPLMVPGTFIMTIFLVHDHTSFKGDIQAAVMHRKQSILLIAEHLGDATPAKG